METSDCVLEIDNDANIYPNVTLLGKVFIGKNTTIMSGSVIENSTVGEGTIIKSSYVEESIIGNNVTIGPFAHIRPGSIIEDNCKIGNFVEIKNSRLGKNSKASHLAYIGDAIIGKNCNIGCGAIFVNYDGRAKHQTVVGNGCFIGSNCNIIAPLKIADNTYICAGTTLTVDTNIDDFVIGRTRETIKNNKANKYLSKEK